jgi:hypothetical protein
VRAEVRAAGAEIDFDLVLLALLPR